MHMPLRDPETGAARSPLAAEIEATVASFWKAGSLKSRAPLAGAFGAPSLPWHIAHFAS